MELQDLVSEFVSKLVSVVESDLRDRLLAAVSATTGTGEVGEKKRRPKQFCLVPGCSGVAAPIFGMVCREHKGISKIKIAKYRKARRTERELSLKFDDGHWSSLFNIITDAHDLLDLFEGVETTDQLISRLDRLKRQGKAGE